MRPYDAVFFAVAAAVLVDRPRRWWLAALAPLAAAAAEPLGAFAAPAAALVACAVAPRLAPAALFLAAPQYAGWAEAVRAAVLWLGTSALLATMEERFDEVAPSLCGAPIRLFVAGVLYYALLPVSYL